MTIYGYARVSSAGQTLVAQDAQLHKAGAAKVYWAGRGRGFGPTSH
jgi:DNA invertase Pin-like site-specific DNA recombinase